MSMAEVVRRPDFAPPNFSYNDKGWGQINDVFFDTQVSTEEFKFKTVESRAKKYNDMKRNLFRGSGMNDAQYLLTPGEITKIQEEILEVLRWDTMIDGIAPTRQIGQGMKDFKWYKWNKGKAPRLTQTFEGGINEVRTKTDTSYELFGMDYDWHLSKPTLDASRGGNGYERFSPSIDMSILSELTKDLAEYRDRFLYRGTDIPGFTDLGITGLLNDANLTDPGAMGTGGDDNLTEFGDVFDSAVILSNALINNKFKPPFVLELSPGVYSQASSNRNTAGNADKTDLMMIDQMTAPKKMGGGKMWSSININPFMIDSETETNSTGAMAAYKPDMRNFFIAESYSMGYYPLPTQKLGIDGKLLWMGRMIVQRPEAIQFADSLTIDVL